MGTPLNIEQKQDYGEGSVGKLFAEEFMRIVNVLDTAITASGDWESANISDALLYALSTAKHNRGFTVSGDGNDIVIESNGFARTSLRDNDIVDFITTASNSGECTLKVDGLRALPLLDSNGVGLVDGYLKENHIQHAKYIESDDVFRLLNTNADADIVYEQVEKDLLSARYVTMDNYLKLKEEFVNVNNLLLIERERVDGLIERIEQNESDIEDLQNK
jgi:hypothetical protein